MSVHLSVSQSVCLLICLLICLFVTVHLISSTELLCQHCEIITPLLIQSARTLTGRVVWKDLTNLIPPLGLHSSPLLSSLYLPFPLLFIKCNISRIRVSSHTLSYYMIPWCNPRHSILYSFNIIYQKIFYFYKKILHHIIYAILTSVIASTELFNPPFSNVTTSSMTSVTICRCTRSLL